MICTHCGKEIQNGITFCPYCGSAVNNAKENTKMKKHNPAKVLAPIAAVAVVAAGGWAFANRTPTIDVSKYMTLSADGYNTVGKLNISFDTEKLEKDYGKQITTRFKKQMKNLKDDTYGLSSLTASLYDGYETDLFAETCATGSADKTKNLSNGDVVTYTWDDNSDEAEEAFGVKVKYSDITYTVSGLASVNTFDAFDGVDVEFSGISPDGRATVNSLPTAAEAQGLYYTLDENSGLSNGDTVTLTVHSNRDDFSDCIDKYGAMPQATEKTFTVEGLNEYVTSADNLSDTALASLQSQHEGKLQFGVEAAGVALVKLLGVDLGLGHGQTRCDGAERPANRVEGQQLKCAAQVDGAADVLRFCVAFGQETFPVKLAVAGSGVDEPKVALGRTDGVVDSDGRDRVGIRRRTLQVANGQSTAEDGRCSGVGVHEGGLLGRVEGEGFIPPEGVCRYCIVLKSCRDVGAGHARPAAFRGMWMGEGRPEGVLPGVGQR